MKRIETILLLMTATALGACGGGGGGIASPPPGGPPPGPVTYSVILTDIELVKKGSDEKIAVESLPAPGATLTRE